MVTPMSRRWDGLNGVIAIRTTCYHRNSHTTPTCNRYWNRWDTCAIQGFRPSETRLASRRLLTMGGKDGLTDFEEKGQNEMRLSFTYEGLHRW